jgi:hypothetical protein
VITVGSLYTFKSNRDSRGNGWYGYINGEILMDYKAMWEELKEKVYKDLDFYVDGKQCFFAESVHGAAQAEDTLHTMAAIEAKHNPALNVRGED